MVVKPLACRSVCNAPLRAVCGERCQCSTRAVWGTGLHCSPSWLPDTVCTWPSQRQGEELSHIAVGVKDMPIK